MKESVRKAFYDINAPLEGVCNFPYLDIKGIVTTGVGNALFSLGEFQALPWTLHGKPASKEEMEFAWRQLKAMPSEAWKRGGGWFANTTSLRLSDEDVRALVERRLNTIYDHLKRRFPEIDSYPADAQLGLLSMAWAMGPGFSFPMFQAHLRNQNWMGCADQCHMDDKKNPGLVPRNKMNEILFNNARMVVFHGLDSEKLYYPHELGKPCPTCGA